METLEEAIRRLIKDKYGSVSRFAESIDIPVTSIYSALDRGMANTRTELTDKIYRKLNIDWNTAKLGNDYRGLKLKDENSSTFIDTPIVASIAAGEPMDIMEIENSFPCPTAVKDNHPNSAWFKVDGNSYTEGGLHDGMYVLVDFDLTQIIPNTPYAIQVNDRVTIKAVEELENGIKLVPKSYDPTYRPLIFDYSKNDEDEVKVLGQAVYASFPYDWSF